MPKPVFDLQLDGLEELLKTFNVYKKIDTSAILVAAMKKIGFEVQGKARELLQEKIYETPESPYYVRTGLLRSSTLTDLKPVHEKDLVKISITSKVHYATYIEFGTSKMKKRAFLLPAVQLSNNEIMEILNAAIFEYLNKEGG